MNDDFDKDMEYIKSFMKDIEEISKKAKEPLDTRIEPMLAIIYSLASEQISLKKRYEWGPRPKPDDEFLDTSDIPSVDDLKKMMEGE